MLAQVGISVRLQLHDWSFVFLVEVGDRSLYKLRLIPVILNYARVDVAKGEELTAICHRMQSLCAAFNTNVIQTSAGLEVILETGKNGILLLM